MALNDDISEVLSEFGLKLTVDTKKSLRDKLNEKASQHGSKKVISRLEASMDKQPPIESNGGVVIFKFVMNDYWEEVDGGRRATEKSGDGSLRKNLVKWIKTRGLKVEIAKRKQAQIDSLKAKTKSGKRIRKVFKKQSYEDAVNSMSYAIASKIHKEGYDGNNFFTDVINDGRIEELKEKLKEVIKTDIQIQISNGING